MDSSTCAQLELQRWPYRRPFAISRGVLTSQTVLYARAVTPWGVVHGEGEPHESDDAVAERMWQRGLATVAQWTNWPSREQLKQQLPPDGLRNALDAMLWDLECKRSGLRVWQLAGRQDVDSTATVKTLVTVTLDTPEQMAVQAAAWATAPAIKVKLGDRNPGGLDCDIQRAFAVAKAAPQAELVIDANEGWCVADLRRFVDATRELNVCLIEQPLPAGQEDLLEGLRVSVPLAADESCTTLQALPRLAGRFDYANIKLDKSGGLTEALDMAQEARRLGLGVMVGCNCGTSLAMASAFVLALQCDLVDLDGPLHLQGDRQPPVEYQGVTLKAPSRALWG
jgi:L-alanine-DL-glutamate epimerase-like enolase superfamily enzyme